MGRDIGVSRNTALSNFIGSNTIQKNMKNGPVLHHKLEEAPNYKARDPETRATII